MVAGRDVAGDRKAEFAINVVADGAGCPGVVVVWEIDTTVIPGVAVRIEAARGLDRDKR